jgi:selenocysteine lyase/cysteine desulfurase
MRKKTYLLRFELINTFPGYCTVGFMYEFSLLEVTWFGMKERRKTMVEVIPFETDLTSYHERLQNLIDNKTPLK